MNRNQPQPEDHESFADHGAETHQLTEIEQRLRMAQPHPVELDVEAIVRLARQESQPIALAQPSGQGRDARAHGWFGVIAGAWACGAVAGAMMMYVLLGWDASPEPAASRATAQKNTPLKVTRPSKKDLPDKDTEPTQRDDSPSNSEPPWSPAESFVSLMLDSYIGGAAPFGDSWPSLRAGIFSRGLTESGFSRFRHRTGAVPRDWPAAPDPAGNAQEGWTPHAAPETPVTRDQLLRELLEASPDTIL